MSLSTAPDAPATRSTLCHADHRPYAHGEALPERVVRNVLDSHGVAARVASDGTVLAWEEATRVVDGQVIDASEWVVAPVDACGFAAWLGY